MFMTQITSPHNQKLKEIRKLRQRRRWRERSGQFVAEGEDLLQSADAGGWDAVERYAAAGSGLAGRRGRAGAAGQRLGPELGDARARGLRGAVGAGAGRAAVRLPARRPRSGQRRRGAALGAGVRGRRASRSARAPPTRSAPRRCARAWARCSRCRSRGPSLRRTLPGMKIALVPGRGDPLDELWRSGRAYASSSAKDLTDPDRRRARGSARRRRGASRPRRAHPDRHRLPERGDGRHHRPVRADP